MLLIHKHGTREKRKVRKKILVIYHHQTQRIKLRKTCKPADERESLSREQNVSLKLLPKEIISGFDRWCHGMFGFYVTYQESKVMSQLYFGLIINYKLLTAELFLYYTHAASAKEKKQACLPLRATPLRRMAVMALLISSSVSKAELTCTTSKSTGTQLNLQHE